MLTLEAFVYFVGKQRSFCPKKARRWSSVYFAVLFGKQRHSVQRKPGDGHQYILLSCLGNSVILSKESQAMVSRMVRCSVWEVATILSQESQAIVIGMCCCPV